MKKFELVMDKYALMGVSIENIEYTIDAIKYGTKRQLIIESLTADYRGMNEGTATNMLNEMYDAYGGEFKKENRGGYLYGIFFLVVGFVCILVIYSYYKQGIPLLASPMPGYRYVQAGAVFAPIMGVLTILKSLLGKYRDEHEPFKN